MPNERREDEKRRREAAQASIAEVLPGGHEVAGRSIKQMVSVRLEAQLLKELRELAEEQGVSISDLLRRAAVELVERSRTTSVLVHYRRTEASSMLIGALTAGNQVTSGVFRTGEDVQLSGNEPVRVLVG
jgi:predicted DNA-binding ribbon-helix-helix protein